MFHNENVPDKVNKKEKKRTEKKGKSKCDLPSDWNEVNDA